MVLLQLSQIGAALLAGCFGGMAFSVYQHIFCGSRKKRCTIKDYLLKDCLFCIVIICIWLIFWFCFTDGSLRISVFFWIALGFSLYTLVFRPRLLPLWDKLPKRKKKRSAGKSKERGRADIFLDRSAAVYLGLRQNLLIGSRNAAGIVRRVLPHREGEKEKNMK